MKKGKRKEERGRRGRGEERWRQKMGKGNWHLGAGSHEKHKKHQGASLMSTELKPAVLTYPCPPVSNVKPCASNVNYC